MNKLNAGKASVLALSATLVVASVLLLNSATNTLAVPCQNNQNSPQCATATPTTSPTASPVTTATATPNDKKVTICHASGHDDTEKFETLELSENAVYANGQGNGGHFNEDGTPAAGHENDYFGACGAESTPTATPVVTSTPEATATPTASSTPLTCSGDTHLDAGGVNCVSFQLSGAPASNGGGQVLGASTMAGTGSFSEGLYQAIMGLGGIFTVKGLKKIKKASKKA